MIEEITGNLLACNANILCHQVNYYGVMGAGVALAIKNKLLSPKQYRNYQQFCQKNGEDALGQVQLCEIATRRYIANCFCQNGQSRKKCVTNYEEMEKCFATIEHFARTNNLSVAFPGYMGCGIAGGDWVMVRLIIEKYFGKSPVRTMIVYLQD